MKHFKLFKIICCKYDTLIIYLSQGDKVMTEQIHERIKRLRKQNKLSVDEIVKKLNIFSLWSQILKFKFHRAVGLIKPKR